MECTTESEVKETTNILLINLLRLTLTQRLMNLNRYRRARVSLVSWQLIAKPDFHESQLLRETNKELKNRLYLYQKLYTYKDSEIKRNIIESEVLRAKM